MAALTAALFAAMALRFGVAWELPAYLYLSAVGVTLGAIDLATKRLPDAITLRSYPVFAALFLLPAVMNGEWSMYLRAGLGGAALFGFYLLIALICPTGMGFGDVKLAGLLGICLAWLGWEVLLIGGFLGFAFGAAWSFILIAVGRSGGRRSEIPFGPFMVAGAITAVLLTGQISSA